MNEKEFFQGNKDEIIEIIADAIVVANRESDDLFDLTCLDQVATGMCSLMENSVLQASTTLFVYPLAKGIFRKTFPKVYEDIRNKAIENGIDFSEAFFEKILGEISFLFSKKESSES